MKNFVFLYLLFLIPSTNAQNSWSDNTFTDPLPSYHKNNTLLNPLNNLVLLDRESIKINQNGWMLNDIKTTTVNNTEPFTSLVLLEQLNILNQSTPFNVAHNATLERYIRVYLKDRKENLAQLLGKASYYFPVFEQYLDQYDLPLEIKYLAVVESALNPTAISASGAKGLWQFMYGTGLEYGLYIDSYVDERYDYIKSTQAACAYLQKLYSTFNDWDLALAAYNSGPGNVNKAILRAGGKTNYWEIRQFLPQETRGYLPAFYATLYLFSYADYHGLRSEKSGIRYYQTDTVHLKGSLSFENIHKSIGIHPDLLKSLNPQYKKDLVPMVKSRQMTLSLPLNMMSRFLENENDLYGKSYVMRQKPVNSKIISINADNSYSVREGDNLTKIALKHQISIDQLKSWNGLQTNYLIEGQSLVVTDKTYISPVLVQNMVELKNENIEKNTGQLIQYTVEDGDTLFKISRKLGNVSIPQIRSWNNLKEVTYLKPGTVLRIYLSESEDKASGRLKS